MQLLQVMAKTFSEQLGLINAGSREYNTEPGAGYTRCKAIVRVLDVGLHQFARPVQ